MGECHDDFEICGIETEGEGELITTPKDTMEEGGFVQVIGSEEKEELKSCLLANGVKLAQSATSITVSRLLDMEPSQLLTLSPVGFLTQVAVSVGLERVHNSKPADYKMVIDTAERHLEEGKQNFSSSQINTVKSWIDDGRNRLQSLQKKVEKPSADPTQQPRKDLTFRALLYGEQQQQQTCFDQTLKDIVWVLREFQKIPHRLIKMSRDKVEENIARHPAIGCLEFSSNLENRAKTIAESVNNPSVKRSLLAFGGPGTAKSTGCRLLSEWSGFPLILLSGESFCRMCNKDDGRQRRQPFDIFMDWITREIIALRVDGVPVMMGIILLDDFHLAMEADGPFSLANESSRTQFLQFVKNMGDSTQDTIFSIDLLPGYPGYTLPLNMTYIHLCMTMNRVPSDMYEKADVALRSRIFNLGANYASEVDRRRMAKTVFWPTFKRNIAEYLNIPIDTLRLDELVSVEEITKVVEADICIVKDKFRGRSGIRGLCDLMEIYRQHIMSKLSPGLQPPPDFFKLAEFEVDRAVSSIEDYKKKIDHLINELELMSANEAAVERVRQQGSRLPAYQALTFNTMLTADGNVRDLEAQLRLYQSRIALESPQTVGQRLKNDFGYLMAGDGGSDVDRFEPFKRVVESMYMRMAASRKGTNMRNDVIYVKPANKLNDMGIYCSLGKLLGGLPVLLKKDCESMMDSDFNAASFHIPAQHEIWKNVLSSSESAFVIVMSGRERTFTARQLVWQQSLFLVFRRPSGDFGEVGILVHNSQLNVIMTSITEKAPKIMLDSSLCVEFSDTNSTNWRKYFTNKMQPRLNCIQKLINQIFHDDRPSVDESLVVFCITSSIYESLIAWASTQLGSEHLSPMSLFVKHLRDHLNFMYCTNMGGRMVDLRGLHVFVLDLTDQVVADLPTGTITWMPGIPPIKGRILHGQNYLKDQIMVTRSALQEYMSAVGSGGGEKEGEGEGKDVSVGEFALNESEQNIMRELLTFDQSMAELAKQHNLLEFMPIAPLETCISAFLDSLKTKMMDVFQLGVKVVDLKTCQAFWVEAYRPYREIIEEKVQRWAEDKRQLEEQDQMRRKFDEKVLELAAQQEVIQSRRRPRG